MNNKNLKIVKIQTNKRNLNMQKQQANLNEKRTNKSMIIQKVASTNSNNTMKDKLKEEIKSNDNLNDLAKKFLIVKPTVTNKCKLNETKLLVKQISCTNKKPQIVRILNGESTNKKIKQNLIKQNFNNTQQQQSGNYNHYVSFFFFFIFCSFFFIILIFLMI